MSQPGSIPDMDAPCGCLLVENMTSSSSSLIGSCERHDQIELRAGIDHPTDAPQNSIHLSKCPETIDVNRRKARGLREQVFVCHDDFSSRWASANHDRTTIGAHQDSDTYQKNLMSHGVASHFETVGALA
jgi:hypothetical protein